MKLKDTAFWDTQMEPLEDLGEELRKKLLDIKAEFITKSSKSEGPGQENTLARLWRYCVHVKLQSGSQQPGQTRRPEQDQEGEGEWRSVQWVGQRIGQHQRLIGQDQRLMCFPWRGMGADSLTLQGSLMCERGAHGHSRGSWRFVFTEQLIYLFDPENRKWIEISPGGQQVKDMLDGDRELTELLMKIANGDCKRWLQKLREHSNEMQETTGAPATTLPIALIKGAAIRPITSVLHVVLTHSILLVVQGMVL
uniref:MHC class I-like antigen recognition-like domain-containing protein n=1 Tax=Mustela putorius furo TaxID=9669 RepID=M3YG36_MUSPF